MVWACWTWPIRGRSHGLPLGSPRMPVPRYSAGIASCGSCRRAGFGIVGLVFRAFWRGISALVWGQGLSVGAVFGLLAGWGLFFPTLSWPLVAAGMMVSVGVVTVSAITSSPTQVIFSRVWESRLSPSELELSLDSCLFPCMRGVTNPDSMCFGMSVGVLGGVCCQVQPALSPVPPLDSQLGVCSFPIVLARGGSQYTVVLGLWWGGVMLDILWALSRESRCMQERQKQNKKKREKTHCMFWFYMCEGIGFVDFTVDWA